MILNELKLILTAWKKMAVCAVFLACFCVGAWLAAVQAVSGERLFEPFTIGVVMEDESAELKLLVQMFNNAGGITGTVTLEVMDYAAAALRLSEDLIPAFVIVPEGFTESVINGENNPLMMVGNENKKLQLAMSRLLLNAGIAFIKTSQSGIYSTLDFAYDSGMSHDEIQAALVMPINFEYMQALLSYEDYFAKEEVSPTGDISAAKYYGLSATALMLGFFLVSVVEPLSAGTTGAAMARYRLCGRSRFRVMLVKQLALTSLLGFMLIPAAIFLEPGILSAAWLFAGVGLAAAVFFPKTISAGLFLFMFSVISAFVSGGIVPLSYLPEVFGRLAVFVPHFWILQVNTAMGILISLGFGTAFLVLSAKRGGL